MYILFLNLFLVNYFESFLDFNFICWIKEIQNVTDHYIQRIYRKVKYLSLVMCWPRCIMMVSIWWIVVSFHSKVSTPFVHKWSTRTKNKVHRVKSVEHWKNKQYRLQFDIKILFVNVKPTVVTYDLFQATVLNLQNICAPSIRRHRPLKWPHKYRCSLIVSSATNFPHHRIPFPCHIYVRTRSSWVVRQFPKHVGPFPRTPLSHGWQWDFFRHPSHFLIRLVNN